MEISISREALSKRKIFLGVPMYGGMCTGMFTRSLCDLTAECVKLGVELRSYFLFNESLITRGRNYCVDEFLRTDSTHMLFIDADIGFDPQHVLTMLALMSDDYEFDVLGGPYAKKNISWEKIKRAVDKGYADEDPNRLEDFVGDFVFNPIIKPGGPTEIRLDAPAQVLEIGTGFMMIKRSVFTRYLDAHPEILYKPDHVRSEAFDGSREIGMYFQAAIDPESRRYLSEDYWFCQKVHALGMKIGLCPWMNLQHTGTYTFKGSLHAMAAIGASATADPNLIKKRK